MRLNPKTAWESVKELAGGMTSHHKTPTVMQIMLPTRSVASTDAENSSVMGPHFEKVYTNHRQVVWDTLVAIPQRSEIIKLDSEITWEELQQAIAKFKTVKLQGSTTSHPKRSSHLLKIT